MKQFLVLLLAGFSFQLLAEPLQTELAPLGEVIVTSLPSAPFPHPNRAQGYTNKTKFFPADKHYSNSTVAIFIPKGFKPQKKTDFIVHFHGWGGDVTNVFRIYKVAEQLVESRRNAILVVPQGPFQASDSFDGKLEDENGFKRFMADVMVTLKERGVSKADKIGKIVLSGHSGGYQVMSSIVAQGGLSDQVKEVWLFDALYAQTEKFTKWSDTYHGKILDIYTENGGTRKGSEALMDDLKKRHVKFVGKNESEITAKDLQKNRLVFIYTSLKHNDVVHQHNTFRDFLNASCFDKTKAK
ncbi:MAG: hypothetical protein JWM68_3094 [Verrucomicrobiales bacterium]|nr:hypothetical protein [Verrucomicrobiales bacterium]